MARKIIVGAIGPFGGCANYVKGKILVSVLQLGVLRNTPSTTGAQIVTDALALMPFQELFGCEADWQSDVIYLRWKSDAAAFGAIHAEGALTRLDNLALELGVEWVVIASSDGGPPLRVWPAGLMRAVKEFYQKEYKRQRRDSSP